MSNDQLSARIVSERARNSVLNVNKEEWLSYFADDAIIEDPVGPSPLNPDGKGHKGKKAISTFWDNNIGLNTLEFDFTSSYDVGNEIAYVGTIKTTGGKDSLMGEGTTIKVELVVVYKINESGKIYSLRAFWEFDKAMETLQQPS